MRQVTTILLLTALLAYTGGSFLVFQIQLCRIKKEMREYTSSHPNTDLAIHLTWNDSFKWVEPNKDFRYQGEMYDVLTVQYNGVDTIVTCIKDENEDDLINTFYKRRSRTRNPKSRPGLKLFTGYCPLNNNLVISTFFRAETQNTFYLFALTNTIKDIPVPPPKVSYNISQTSVIYFSQLKQLYETTIVFIRVPVRSFRSGARYCRSQPG